MKKLIAISVMLALVAGAVFAQVSGTVEARLFIVDATFDKNKNNEVTHGDIGAAYIQLSGTNEEGTLGGLFRFRNTDVVRDAAWFHRVFVWWRPIQQVRIFLGIDNDGMFDTASIAGWAFHSGDNDYMFNHHWDFWREIFPGNWDGFGLALSFWPVQGLNINLVIPTGGLGWPQSTLGQVRAKPQLKEIYPWGLRLQMSYAIPDIGTINFVYNLGDKDTDMGHYAYAPMTGSHFGRIGVSFLLTAIDSMNLLIGGSVVIPDKLNEEKGLRAHAGIAYTYSGTGWGIKVRFGYRYHDMKDEAAKDLQFINANIMPIINAGGGQVMIDFGISAEPSRETNKFGWYLTPVFRYPIPGGKFSVGLQLYQNIQMGGNVTLTGDKNIHLRIPMLLSFGF